MVSSHEFASFFISNIVLADGTDSTGKFFTSVPPLTVLYLELTLSPPSQCPTTMPAEGMKTPNLWLLNHTFFFIGS